MLSGVLWNWTPASFSFLIAMALSLCVWITCQSVASQLTDFMISWMSFGSERHTSPLMMSSISVAGSCADGR